MNPVVSRQGWDEKASQHPNHVYALKPNPQRSFIKIVSDHPSNIKLLTEQCPTPLIHRCLVTLSSLIGIPLQSIKSQNYATARVLGCLGVCGKAVFEVSAGLKAACGLDTDVWLFDRISVVTSNLDAFGEERGFFLPLPGSTGGLRAQLMHGLRW